jgi:hypothetical protein
VSVIERRWTLHAVNEDNRRTANAMVEGPMIGPGDAPVEVVPADRLAGAVHFTDEERERVLWWLRRPVHPGPMKDLDERILRKLNGGDR